MAKNFFDTIKKSFADVQVDKTNNNAINTDEFLEASESLVTLFDVLGSAAFKPVKNDMIGNVKKIRDRRLAAPAESETLQSLCINELKTKKHTATEGLLWLNRGLDFTAKALRDNTSEPSHELSVSFRAAYTDTLKPHHGMLIKPLFNAAMSACPYRKDFYAKLLPNQSEGSKQMEEWLSALEEQVEILKTFLSSKEAKW